jgi:hypothetical protein
MSQVDSSGPSRTGRRAGTRQRRELNRAVRESMRDLAAQLSLLTHQIGGRLDLKGTDLDCLDLIDRYGPIGPGAIDAGSITSAVTTCSRGSGAAFIRAGSRTTAVTLCPAASACSVKAVPVPPDAPKTVMFMTCSFCYNIL